ncbi:hypothetical protein [Thermocatellispora tengchongensis]|uniref:hypothetical protein n=1 Tax=Thermocatellispora tengchongensis TaxID=1073253 RepID=UPI003632E712
MTVVGAPRIVPKAGALRSRKRSWKPRRSLPYLLYALLERGIYVAILGGLIVEVVRSGFERVEGAARRRRRSGRR